MALPTSPTVSTKPSTFHISTYQGEARAWVFPSQLSPRASVMLGHGAGGGVEAWDLQLLATALPRAGYPVVLVEQPWRVAGRKVAVAPPRLDEAWLTVVHELVRLDVLAPRIVLGGRSAGARVACRTAQELPAIGVLALAFPLHPPGRPDKSRADELEIGIPTLVVQGDRDSFGGPKELSATSRPSRLLPIPGADHSLKVARSAVITQHEAGELIIDGCLDWLESLSRRESPSKTGR